MSEPLTIGVRVAGLVAVAALGWFGSGWIADHAPLSVTFLVLVAGVAMLAVCVGLLVTPKPRNTTEENADE